MVEKKEGERRLSFLLDLLPQCQSGNNWENEMQTLILSGICARHCLQMMKP